MSYEFTVNVLKFTINSQLVVGWFGQFWLAPLPRSLMRESEATFFDELKLLIFFRVLMKNDTNTGGSVCTAAFVMVLLNKSLIFKNFTLFLHN